MLKKYFIGNVPRSDPIALLAVTRETVDSCIPIASATERRVMRPQVARSVVEEALLLADDLARHLEDGGGALVEGAGEPAGASGAFAPGKAWSALLRADWAISA